MTAFDLIVTVLAVAGIVALYGFGIWATARWAARNCPWPTWAVTLLALAGGVFAPVWVPVWAVGRWMGLWGRPKPALLPPGFRSPEQQLELYRRWRNNPGQRPPVSAHDWAARETAPPPHLSSPFLATDLPPERIDVWQDSPQVIEMRDLTPHDRRHRKARFTELPPA